MRKCKGCGKEYERISMSGFCDSGICTFREEGYVMAQREMNPLRILAEKQQRSETDYFRQMGIKVDD